MQTLSDVEDPNSSTLRSRWAFVVGEKVGVTFVIVRVAVVDLWVVLDHCLCDFSSQRIVGVGLSNVGFGCWFYSDVSSTTKVVFEE